MMKRDPITSPTEENDPYTGQSGPTPKDEFCMVCRVRPKDATILHGATGHVCCCLACAQDLHGRQARCPICRDPIDSVIRQFTA